MRVQQDWPTWVREGLVDGLCLWYREFIDPATIPYQTSQVAEVVDGRCPLIVELSCYHRGALKTNESIIEAGQLALAGGADAVGIYRADPVEALNLWPAVEGLAHQNS